MLHRPESLTHWLLILSDEMSLDAKWVQIHRTDRVAVRGVETTHIRTDLGKEKSQRMD